MRRAASSPAVHDSATAIVAPRRAAARPPGRRRSSRPRRTASAVPRADEVHQGVVLPLRGGLEARRDLDLAAPQAGRDLQPIERQSRRVAPPERPGDLGLGQPVEPHDLPPVLPRAGDRGPERAGGHRRLPHRPQLVGRPGQHDDGRPGRARVAPPRGHDEPGRGSRPGRARSPRPGSPPACGSRAAPHPRRGRASAASAAAGSPRSAPPAPRRAPSRARRSARRARR